MSPRRQWQSWRRACAKASFATRLREFRIKTRCAIWLRILSPFIPEEVDALAGLGKMKGAGAGTGPALSGAAHRHGRLGRDHHRKPQAAGAAHL